jgi:hypothetical protein
VFGTSCLKQTGDTLRQTIIASVPTDAIIKETGNKKPTTKRIQLGSSVLDKLKQYEAKKE